MDAGPRPPAAGAGDAGAGATSVSRLINSSRVPRSRVSVRGGRCTRRAHVMLVEPQGPRALATWPPSPGRSVTRHARVRGDVPLRTARDARSRHPAAVPPRRACALLCFPSSSSSQRLSTRMKNPAERRACVAPAAASRTSRSRRRVLSRTSFLFDCVS